MLFDNYLEGRVIFMKTLKIMLESISDVKDFVNIVNKCDFDVDLTSGRYVVDAKSIMGIFSLDLSKPIKMEIHKGDCSSFYEEIKRFIVQD
jgi:phosphocarrier protein HPr